MSDLDPSVSVVFFLFLLLVAHRLREMVTGHRCLQCGGRGNHRQDCPWA